MTNQTPQNESRRFLTACKAARYLISATGHCDLWLILDVLLAFGSARGISAMIWLIWMSSFSDARQVKHDECPAQWKAVSR